MKMKRNFVFVIMLFTIFGYTYCQKPTVYANNYFVKIGDMAPDFAINEAGGRSYKLSDLRGKVVMLQFTASWCSVCRTEMPFIEKDIWQARKSEGLVVLGIDRDEPVEKVIKFKKDIGISYPLVLDPGAGIFGMYAEKEAGVTRNVIIDRSGKIIFLTRLYEQTEFDQMKKVIINELAAK